MKTNIKNEKQAARVFHPGEILLDEIMERQFTQAEFSEIIGRPPRTVNEIIKGKRGITPETAEAIGAALGTSPDMWLSMQGEYDLFVLSKKTKEVSIEIKEKSRIYSLFPVADLVKRKYIKLKGNVDELKQDILALLGIPSEGNLEGLVNAQFRTSKGDIIFSYLTTWILLAKKIAVSQKVCGYDQEKLIEFSKTIKNLSPDPRGIEVVVNKLNELGVRIVFLPHFSKTRVDGAACWLDNESPLIVMSLRYERIDNFYFTLLHEIGHLILHRLPNNKSCFVDDIQSFSEDDKEKDANKFAIEKLGFGDIVADLKFVNITPQIIIKKSEELGVHPSLLIGHLQHENILNYSAYQKYLNKNKVKQMIPATLIEK